MADADELLQQWLDAEMERHPVAASGLGLEGYDDRLGDFSAESFERRGREDRAWDDRLAALPPGELSLDQGIDVQFARAQLAGREVMRDWKRWQRDPGVYLNPCLEGVFDLFLDRLHPEDHLARAASARLRQVGSALAAAQSNLDPALVPRLLAERGLGAARAGITYFRERLPQEVADPAGRAELASAAEEGAEALENFAAFLSDLVGNARGDWAIGEARYTGLLNQRELLGSSAADLAGTARGVWRDLDAEMTEVARHIDPSAGSWQEAAALLSRRHPADPEEMRLAYEGSVAGARVFLAERDLVTFAEGESCSVEPSPPFRRPLLAVASYSGPPPFSSGRQGHFFVPFPPEGTTPEQLDQRLSDNSFAVIPSISVHEAYPGHHWHMSWSAGQPRPVRKTFRTPYFLEGWALYAEALMREQGFFTDAGEELLHLDMRLFRAVRVVLDTGLHSGEMTPDQAISELMTGAGLTEAVARAEVDRYCAWPTQASSYLTGALQIEAARAGWLSDHPGELRRFHDGIAASPGIPVALAEEQLRATAERNQT